MSDATAPRVGIVMGSDSDWPVMKAAADALAEFDVPFEADVVSAHRMPERMLEYGRTAADRGLSVIIAGAGGAAHLPGMLASVTPAARHRRTRAAQAPRRHGLAALDRADARGRSRRHRVGRRGAQRRAPRRAGARGISDAVLRDRMVEFQDELRRQAEEKGEAVRAASGPNRRAGF